MSSEPQVTPVLKAVFERFAQSLPLLPPEVAEVDDVRGIPAYRNVRVNGKILGLGTWRTDITYASPWTIMASLDDVLVTTFMLVKLINGTAVSQLRQADTVESVRVVADADFTGIDEDCRPETLFDISDELASVTETSGRIRNTADLYRWMLLSLVAGERALS